MNQHQHVDQAPMAGRAAAVLLAAWLGGCAGAALPSAPTVAVMAAAETVPVASAEDAADDPAIWVHPSDPAASLVIGTNKQRGLDVYGLDGGLRQSLPDGRMNNVDLRDGFQLGGESVVLVAASERNQNAIALYAFSAGRPELVNVAMGVRSTGLTEIYGLCMYADRSTGRFFVFVNDKDGRYQQHEAVALDTGRVATRLVREFALASQPEGCVADDASGLLYVGEEAAGFYRVAAAPDAPANPVLVDAVGSGRLVADVEGIALYARPDGSGFLVVSSQGDSAFAVYRRQPPNDYVGRFRVVANPTAGVDGVSETDGLDITSAALPEPYGRGLVVVQDGMNTEPAANQNFKLIPWSAVEAALALP